MLTASSCATLAAVRCRITPITLFTVGNCELETNLGIDGNRTTGSMPPDFALVKFFWCALITKCSYPKRTYTCPVWVFPSPPTRRADGRDHNSHHTVFPDPPSLHRMVLRTSGWKSPGWGGPVPSSFTSDRSCTRSDPTPSSPVPSDTGRRARHSGAGPVNGLSALCRGNLPHPEPAMTVQLKPGRPLRPRSRHDEADISCC